MKQIKTKTIKGEKTKKKKKLLCDLGMLSKGQSAEMGGMEFTRLR